MEGDVEITEELFSYYFSNKIEGKQISKQFIHHLFKAFDRDQNEKISFFEFLVGLTFFKSDDHYQNLKVFFRLFDLNHDKFIKKSEIEIVLRALDKASNMKLNFHENMINDLDLNHDNKIDEDEFIYGIIYNTNYQEFIKQIQK